MKSLFVILLISFSVNAFASFDTSCRVDSPLVFKIEKQELDTMYPFMEVNYDSIYVVERSFDSLKINDILSDRDYIYDRRPPRDGIGNFLRYWWRKLFTRNINQATEGLKPTFWATLIDIILYTVAALAVILLIIQLLKTQGIRIFNTQNTTVDYQLTEENIHEINFEQQIQNALQEKNYQWAIRYAYLQLLKKLTDQSLIEWTNAKTNLDYTYELPQQMRDNFKRITYHFEENWYGTHQTTERDYHEFNELIKQFKQTTK